MPQSVDIESTKLQLAQAIAGPNFALALSAIDAEKNDGQTTPLPKFIYPYERMVLEGYPAVEMQGLRTAYDSASSVKDGTQRIAIVVTHVGDNEFLITQQVERLVRAIRDLIWRSVLTADIGLAPMLVESEEYSQLAPHSGYPFMKGGMLIVAAVSFAA